MELVTEDFFRTELNHPERTVKHFVTDERGGVPGIAYRK